MTSKEFMRGKNSNKQKIFKMKKSTFKSSAVMALLLLLCVSTGKVYAQSSSETNDVELIVASDGATKDEATRFALRSAIEQAFGTFVSSKTNILNDELVKDEIATVTSGNIKAYEYISEDIINGKYFVTLKTVVSTSKLISFCKSKGIEVEFEGALFAMNVKMDRMLKNNAQIAELHLYEKLAMLSEQPLYDYRIEIGEPKMVAGWSPTNIFRTPVVIFAWPNKNANNEIIEKTLLEINQIDDKYKELKYHLASNTNHDFWYQKNQLLDKIRKNLIKAPWDFVLNDDFGEYYFNSTEIEDIGIPDNVAVFFHSGCGDGKYQLYANNKRVHLYANNVYTNKYKDILKKVSRDSKYPYEENIADLRSFRFELYLDYTLEEMEKLKKISVKPRLSQENWLHLF